ncbi:MAG: helix-turn-helix transcriptional regulator [Rhodospirillaceae bacterium]|nr:helix-turn-helix transcriptional regulator [Rhodospirillaceae bacterium]MCA8934444.1 helix-turn-helix transcriptional regulator [Rhodospirillaceae bacterium]
MRDQEQQEPRPLDRRDFLDTFRSRLTRVIADSGLNRSAFARSVGIDRSTLSQLLSPDNDRLPRVESLVAIASARRVGLDWLLGLTHEDGQIGADIMRERMSIERDALSPVDERLLTWHREARGYKIRYVPSTLPDILKTEAVIRYELAHFSAQRPEQRIETAITQLAFQRRPETDMEACTSIQSVETFALGHGIWRKLPRDVREEQLDVMIERVEELYPTFRWFLFDGLQRFSSPFTIFGPNRAALYVGQMYFVFPSMEHVRALTEHFDGLIRGAVVQPTEVSAMLRELRAELRRTADEVPPVGEDF